MTFHAPSFSAGIVLGAVLLTFAIYAPEFLESRLPAAEPSATAETPFTFEFHKLLANSEVLTNASPYRAEPLSNQQPLLPGVDQQWYLQAGSFRRPDDAERLTARLLLIDLPAEVSAVSLDDGSWYRVTVGPFASKQATQRSMTRLRQLDISALMFAKPVG